jgi:hypothetical protein
MTTTNTETAPTITDLSPRLLHSLLCVVEIDGDYAPDLRRVPSAERQSLGLALESGDDERIADAATEAARVAEMWGVRPRAATRSITIVADAISTTLQASSGDDAARQFAAGEGIAGIEDAADLCDHYRAIGGTVRIIDADGAVLCRVA